jgi:hypothetical protein
MKEELQTKLVEILGSIQTAAGKAGDFAMIQLPDIAQSYVVYGRVVTSITSAALVVFGALLLGLAFWAYKNPWNLSIWDFERNKKRSDSNIIVMVFPGGGGAIAIFAAFASFDWLVWLAPKVWLLKEIATLIK